MKSISKVKFHTSVMIGAKEKTFVNSEEYNIKLNDSETIFSIHHRRDMAWMVVKVPAINAAWWYETSEEVLATKSPKFTDTLTPAFNEQTLSKAASVQASAAHRELTVSDLVISQASAAGIEYSAGTGASPTPVAEMAPVTVRRRVKRGNASADA